MKGNVRPRDYNKYIWTWKELFLVFGRCVGVVGILSYYFYRSPLAMVLLSFPGFLYFKFVEREKTDLYKEELLVQFRECILSVVTAMKAGYAVENAFMESRSDMRLLYGEESAIYRELELFRRGLIINISLEELIRDLAARSGTNEIEEFAEVFSIAKRNSGNITETMESSARLIGRRLETKQEILNLLGAKKTEWMIMKCVPFGMMTYLDLSNPGYFSQLYHNAMGVLVMTVCLILYLVAYLLGERMLRKITEELV